MERWRSQRPVCCIPGRKVEGNDQTISYKMGGSYTMKTSFDYVPEMAKSELYLEFKATVGKRLSLSLL